MPCAIVVFPTFEGLEKVNSIRERFDPNYNQIKTHITLVYPFTSEVRDEEIHEILKDFSPFAVKLDAIRASSKDNYIFLDITDGKKEIMKLHRELYNKLKLAWKEEFMYRPHISIANPKTKQEQKIALQNIQEQHLDFTCTIDSIYLLTVADDLLALKSMKKFQLS